MAIPRTPMIDDDGSGTTGTILNNAWKQELYDQIDASSGVIAGGNKGDVVVRDPAIVPAGGAWLPGGLRYLANADNGTRNDWAPTGLGISGTLIDWTGAADLTVTGIAGPGVIGQIVVFKNRAVGRVAYFKHADAGSIAGNRLVLAVTSAPTPVCAGGWAQFVYTAAGWLLLDFDQGAFLIHPWNAADFTTGDGSAWTVQVGDLVRFGSTLIGRSVNAEFTIQTTTVVGTPNELRFKVPGGYTSAGQIYGVCTIFDGPTGQYQFGQTLLQATLPYIVARIVTIGAAFKNFSTTTDNTWILGTLVFDVQ